jgi:hypothetical protein
MEAGFPPIMITLIVRHMRISKSLVESSESRRINSSLVKW